MLENLDLALELVHLLALPPVFLDRPFEVESHGPEENTGLRVASKIREDLVGRLAPDLRARQRDHVVMVATHGGRPFPQRPGDDRGDPRCEPVGDHRDLEPSPPQAEGAGQAADPRPDNEHASAGASARIVER